MSFYVSFLQGEGQHEDSTVVFTSVDELRVLDVVKRKVVPVKVPTCWTTSMCVGKRVFPGA